MAAEKIWTFYGFRALGKHILRILYDLGYIFALTKTNGICMYFSVASPKVLTLSKI